ncbi:MAG: Wzz/FepE/Etk N-terminal domain-containing protein [Patescibacteria group bacterium]
MNIINYKETIRIIKEKKWLIFWLTIFGAVLFFDLLVIQPPKYKASSSILVVQEQVEGQDIYSISKSAQYICQVLKEGIYSDSFFNKVIGSSDQIKTNDFPEKLKERRKEWQKSVEVKIIRDLGLMEINVFYSNKEKTENLSMIVTDVLKNNHDFYHGSGENVKLKILNSPLVSEKPISINLWLGTFFGALLGFCSALFWIFRKKIIKEGSFLDGNNFSI